MSEMVERVARALVNYDSDNAFDDLPESLHSYMRGAARAAIAAMREPPMELLQDMPPTSAAIWKAMIDAALEPVGDEERP